MQPVNKSEIAVLKIFGARMREARQLCEFSREKAASLLQISIDELSKIENCVDVELVPLKLIKNASQVFDVSADFLLGENDDWEKSEDVKLQRAIGQWIHTTHQDRLCEVSNRILIVKRQVNTVSEQTSKLIAAVSELTESVNNFKKANKNFDDMLASSQLMHRNKKANEATIAAKTTLVRYKIFDREVGNNDL